MCGVQTVMWGGCAGMWCADCDVGRCAGVWCADCDVGRVCWCVVVMSPFVYRRK